MFSVYGCHAAPCRVPRARLAAGLGGLLARPAGSAASHSAVPPFLISLQPKAAEGTRSGPVVALGVCLARAASFCGPPRGPSSRVLARGPILGPLCWSGSSRRLCRRFVEPCLT